MSHSFGILLFFLSVSSSSSPHQLTLFFVGIPACHGRCGIPARHGRYSIDKLPSLHRAVWIRSRVQLKFHGSHVRPEFCFFSLRRHVALHRRRYMSLLKRDVCYSSKVHSRDVCYSSKVSPAHISFKILFQRTFVCVWERGSVKFGARGVVGGPNKDNI